ARSAGVKPVIGADCWIDNPADRDKPFRLLLLCASRAGYLRLCDLLSRAWLRNQHRGRPLIARDWLAGGTDGLIALSGGAAGELAAALLSDHGEGAERIARGWAALFPGRYYVEVQRAGLANGEALVSRSVALAASAGLPVVATHPVQFLQPDDFKAHEARVCIAQGHVLGDQRRPRLFTAQQFFKTQAQMAELFADLPQALANSLEIARRCNLEIELGRTRLPAFPTPPGATLEQFLEQQAEAGLARRIEQVGVPAAAVPRYRERLAFEIRTIVQMGFAGYFLIVADFINWAKSNAVPVGPGRGSGAGSLVAYSLGITDLDPLRYDLLFERFLNPERVSMPDFDIDFCQDGRDRVIDYVRRKYGEESVSQIATFGTMAARAVLRDVGRVLDLGYNFCDQIAKLIPFQPGKLITLEMAREMEPLLAEREKKEDEVRELLALGEKLEGLVRNVGMHAGGVLIAPGKLTDYCPLYAAEGTSNVISQLDKDDVEKVGLVKFDFLGLTTLTILDWAERYVQQMAGDARLAEFSLRRIPLDDAAAYQLLSAGNTTAVFQLESRGMRDLIKRARPDRFEDVIALVALYRPGPMDLIPDFIARKHGQQRVEYLDARLQPILGPTYGIMVYQEQVMQIAQVIGGYTLGGADLLRRAMGKKKPEEMAQQRDIFVGGAEKNGLSRSKASQLFDLMEKFAGYGFNKSHAAAYALLAYQTAYMKAHHAAAFVAANLSAVMDDTDKVRQFYEDGVQNGLTILPPDINASQHRFVPVDRQTIRYGLGAVRGTGEAAIAAIVEARRGAPFADLFDFCRRVDKRHVNRRVVEALVRAGAFDKLDGQRARLLASVGRALEAAEQAERAASQSSLFGEAEAPRGGETITVDAAPWDLRQKLMEEKAALGFYLSAHLFSVYERELGGFPRTPLARLAASESRTWIAGVVASARMQMTRRGRMMVVMLDDGTAQVEISVFSELLERHRDRLKDDALLVVAGRVQRDDFSGGFRVTAEELLDLDGLRARFAARLRLAMNGQADARRLQQMLAPYRASGSGACQVVVAYRNAQAACDVALGDAWRVRPDSRLIAELGAWLAPENVELVYGTTAAPA
ncbi:MAG TPA: DNA polymerase III subunit alpha, partial [Burkholderiales bacterium]|nr:DNA polymerase III subunit alpha [Burkholderiales bacterium]